MAQNDEYLTPRELSARWKGVVSPGTLANWRSKRKGPPHTKVGGRILYGAAGVEAWEQRHSFKNLANDGAALAVAA